MLNRVLVATGAMLVCAIAAGAQKATSKKTHAGLTWTSLAGTWKGSSSAGKDNAVLSHFTLRFSADKSATVKRGKNPPAPVRVLSVEGDSVTVEYGPVPSATRRGHTATMHEVLHVHGRTMRGSLHAVYDDGQVLDGTVKLKRQRK